MSLAAFYISEQEYLATEPLSEVRREYVDGIVYAMAGASAEHGRIAMNIGGSLRNQLGDSPCEVFLSDLRVMVPNGKQHNYYYPDVLVDCSRPAGHATATPTVIFEIFSASTQRIDRKEKLAEYSPIPSLRVYVLVQQEQPAVIAYRRSADQIPWEVEYLADLKATLHLPEIGCRLPLTEIYRRTTVAQS